MSCRDRGCRQFRPTARDRIRRDAGLPLPCQRRPIGRRCLYFPWCRAARAPGRVVGGTGTRMRSQIPCRQAAVWVRKELIVMNNTHSEAATGDTVRYGVRKSSQADGRGRPRCSRRHVSVQRPVPFGRIRFFFFDVMNAIGVSRRCRSSFIKGAGPKIHSMSAIAWRVFERELEAIPAPIVKTSSWGTLDATETAVKHIKQLGDGVRRVADRTWFLPADADNFLVPNSAMWNCAMHNSSLSGCAR